MRVFKRVYSRSSCLDANRWRYANQHNNSPEDHAILEAEYQRNSKPDKATRAEIVKRVSLGDKEVQVLPAFPLLPFVFSTNV